MNAEETQPKADPAATAAALIRRHGRLTPARLQVLSLLLAADSALSHADLDALLGHGVDRVTLYRVLEWLVRCGLAHRIAGEDRIWRFGLSVATATTKRPAPSLTPGPSPRGGGEASPASLPGGERPGERAGGAGGEGIDGATFLPRGGVAKSVGAVATPARSGHEHAHFLCESCGRAFCLDEMRPVFALSLPAGFRLREAELTLHGLCPRCASAALA